MIQTATVKNVHGKLAEIEVSRKAMCDGCHNTNCGSGCPMSGLFSSGKSMIASALNKAGASPGDTVEIETSDKEVLASAVLIFILPVILGGAFYAVSSYFDLSSYVSAAHAVLGFILPFPIFRIAENKAKKKEPNIIITRIINDNAK